MPFGSYLMGAMFYGGRGRLRTRAKGDAKRRKDHFEGLECYTLLMPLFPSHAVHVWDWQQTGGERSWVKNVAEYSYRAIPIRWSRELVYRTLLRFWLWLPLLNGVGYFITGSAGLLGRVYGLLLSGAAGGALLWLRTLEQRDRKIRRLLGRHLLGFSDPAAWTDELRGLLAPAEEWFDAGSFAEAAVANLDEGRYAEAMWAARLCAAVEDREQGEALTDRILDRCHELPAEGGKRAWPLLRPDNSEAGQFWRGTILGRSKAKYTETMYADHLGGALAQALEPDDPEAEAELEQQESLMRDDPSASGLGIRGLGAVAGIVFLCVMPAALTKRAQGIQRDLDHQAHVRQIEEGRAAAAAARKKKAEDHARYTAQVREFLEQAEGDDRVYVAELPLIDTQPGPWPVATNGTTGQRTGRAVVLYDIKSPQGIGMHPPESGHASARFELPAGARRLHALAAMNQTAGPARDTVTLEAWGDGRRLWQSRPLGEPAQFDVCEADLRGVKILELRTIANGDYEGLHAVWFAPHVELSP